MLKVGWGWFVWLSTSINTSSIIISIIGSIIIIIINTRKQHYR